MKTYRELCRTCGGVGFIITPKHMNLQSTTPISDICPVCNGSKVQTIIETK